MQFNTTSSPHLKPSASVAKVMGTVILAMLPGLGVALWQFGWPLLFNLLLAVFTALFCEAIVLQTRGRDAKRFLSDGSAVLTALLLAVAIPAGSPWWLVVIGVFFAIVVAKQLFGGLGYNPFNPAMIGYVVLLICFPVEMTRWLSPTALGGCSLNFAEAWQLFAHGAAACIDGLSAATPLDEWRTAVSQEASTDKLASLGYVAGAGWEWLALAWLAGGAFMLLKGTIKWQIPAAMLCAILLWSGLFWLIDAQRFADPLFHLLGGATMLGAFFIATDPVSASTTPRGRLIYGFGIGSLVFIIRAWGGYPDAVAFAVLIMNMTAPLLDYYTQPRVFGHKG